MIDDDDDVDDDTDGGGGDDGSNDHDFPCARHYTIFSQPLFIQKSFIECPNCMQAPEIHRRTKHTNPGSCEGFGSERSAEDLQALHLHTGSSRECVRRV